MKKRLTAFLLSILMLPLMSCGLATTNGTTAPSGGNNGEEDTEDITLTFWHIWPEGQSLYPIIERYIDIYETENEHITIEAVGTQEDQYQQTKLKVAAATSSQGDVFMTWGGGYSKTFVDAGAVLPLTEYFDEYKVEDELLGGAMTYGTYDDVPYGLPLKQWAGVLFCNKDLFDEYEVAIPDTFDALLQAVETFRLNDVTPMVLGAKDAWHIGMIQNALAIRTAGPDYMNQALAGEATFDTEEISQSAQLLLDLHNAGAFTTGTLGIGADEAEEEFYSVMVPMFFGGSWVAAGVDDPENAVSEANVVVVPMPTVEGGKGSATDFSGGVIDFFMVNNKTAHPDEAFDFAYGMTKYMSQESFIIGDSLPAWKNIDTGDVEVSPTLTKIEEMLRTSTGYALAWDTFLQGSAIDAHYNLLQGLLDGSVTPEGFAEQMQAAQEEVKGQ